MLTSMCERMGFVDFFGRGHGGYVYTLPVRERGERIKKKMREGDQRKHLQFLDPLLKGTHASLLFS